ncbi:large ribosomal subunit protein bL20m [Prorops nasuta]|uniref:large ribosomal subunit protein bL20m n=1 Tax=Prorops nasuta TaxID=863751 RepID=UPI0034D01497
MVFLTACLFGKGKGPDEIWRKRKIFKLAAHFIGRRRNCYSIAIRSVTRALVYTTKARKLKKLDMQDLWTQRLTAAGEEHGINKKQLLEGLTRCNILLNNKTLADLAIWEPRTFKSLVDVACTRIKIDRVYNPDNLDIPPNTVINDNLD